MELVHKVFVSLGDRALSWLDKTLIWEYSSPFPLLQGPCLVVCWHSRLLMLPFIYPQQRNAAALVSPSADGELLSRVLLRWGRKVIRGSSRRGFLAAVRQVLEFLDRGYDVAVTLDGPLGPPQKAKPALIRLAVHHHIPIFPLSYTPLRYLTLPTWDRLIIPLPYTISLAQYGKPIIFSNEVDPRLAVTQVETSLNQLLYEGEEWAKRYRYN